MRRLYQILFYGLCAGSLSCQDADPGKIRKIAVDTILPVVKDTAYSSLAGDFSATSAFRFDSLQLNRYFKSYFAFRPLEKEIRSFYRMRKYAFAWYDYGGLTEQAGNLYNRVRLLPSESPGDSLPYAAILDSLMDTEMPIDASSRIRGELLLTSAYFHFASRAWQGVDPSQSARLAWFVPRKQTSYASWLQGYSQSIDTTFREPVYRQYNLLRGFLQHYRELARQDDWVPLHPSKNIALSRDSVIVRKVCRRLIQLGDLDSMKAATDSDLTVAIHSFQQRMGLAADGKLTLTVVKALNVSFKARIRTILVNMERNRWLPDTAHGRYLVVNIPEFRLHAYQDDSLLWNMKVVVGKAVHKTVIFSGTMRYVVFSPYWNVPAGILKKEILPGIGRDPAYLTKHHMERYNDGVRQRPGPWNSLGAVKFLFPNSHSIYLHDTPAKGLFTEKDRAFSHGCIRLAEPAKLAAWLLRDDPAWTAESIRQAMSSEKEKWVNAPEKVRVFIVYFTAWVDRQGRLNLRNDVYGRDKRLAAVILP